jgi:hypothetical protein
MGHEGIRREGIGEGIGEREYRGEREREMGKQELDLAKWSGHRAD